jgi:hypothetical protein
MELWTVQSACWGKLPGIACRRVQIRDGGVITVARQRSASEQDVDIQRSEAMSIFP